MITKYVTASLVAVGAAQAGLAITLTYEGLGVADYVAIPSPYPGVPAATVSHQAVSNGVFFEGVFFWGGVSPNNGYGNLTNVAVGPNGPDVFAGITITPRYPSNYIRLISFDMAAKDDGGGDLSFICYVQDTDNRILASPFVEVAGDVENTVHTHVDFNATPIEGPVDKGLSLYWPASGGRVAVDNVQFEILGPIPQVVARTDFYSVAHGASLTVPAPGVLTNDSMGEGFGPLTAVSLSEPTLGVLSLSSDGSFAYTSTNSTGMDGFIYKANDGEGDSEPAVALISVRPSRAYFYDDFRRPGGVDLLAPWQVAPADGVPAGIWTITNGMMQGTAGTNSVGYVYYHDNWTDYSVEARATFPTEGCGWALGGRLDPQSGRHYVASLLPTGPPISGRPYTWMVRLAKYTGWGTWSGTTMANQPEVNVGGPNTDLHRLKLTFLGNRVLVHFDGTNLFDVMDDDFEGAPFDNGGIVLGLHPGSTNNQVLRLEEVIVDSLNPPVATNVTVTTPEDTATNLLLLGGSPVGSVTFAIATMPTNGILSELNPVSGAVRYTPVTNYNGPDAFEFTVGDGTLIVTGLASVVVTPINDAPWATSFSLETHEDTATNLTLLGNDVENPVTFMVLDTPTNGVLSNLNPNTGVVDYTPATNYHGFDAFSFVVSDGAMQATGLVNVTILPVNDAPVAADLIVEMFQNSEANLQLPGSDAEGPLRYAIFMQPNAGLLSNLNADSGMVTYTPGADFDGSDAFTYSVNDGTLSATGLVKITVLPAALGFHAGVEIVGNLGLLPDLARDLSAYRLGDGTNVSLAWTHVDAGSACRIFAQGRYAFVAGGPEGLIVVDLTESDLSIAEGQFQTEGTCVDVVVSEKIAFIADLKRGVVALDINSPPYPLEISTVASNRIVLGLDVLSNLLYVATDTDGLLIYDVSDAVSPVLLAGLPTTGSAMRVRVHSDLAFVIAGGGSSLEIVNVTNPQAPVLVGSYSAAGRVADLDLNHNHVFLANTNGLIEVLSVSDPANPVLVTNLFGSGGAAGIRVVGNVAYVRDLHGNLTALSVPGLSPALPTLRNPVKDALSILGKDVVLEADVEGSAPLVYQWYKDGVPLEESGRITGTTNALLKLSAVQETDGGMYSVFVSNAVGQASSSNAALTVVLPGTPVHQGSIKPGGFTTGVWTDGRYAYAAAGSAGLRAFDVSNPRFPLAAGGLDTDGDALAVEVMGNLAFVAEGTAGVRIVDLINMPFLSPVGVLDTLGTAYRVNVIAGKAFVADGEMGLLILDVRNPGQPVLSGSFDTPGIAYAVRTRDDLAYVADGLAGVQIISVSNVATPMLIGHFDTPGTAYRVEVVGSHAYVADGTNGLVILDVSDPTSPGMIGHYSTSGPVLGLTVVDSLLALLAEGVTGLEVVNISDPANVAQIAAIGGLGEVRDVALAGNSVVAACGTNGVRMLSLFGITPAPPQILSASGDEYLLPGEGAILQVAATGANPLRYQWFKNGRMLLDRAGVHGVISDTLQLTNLSLGDSGEYSLSVWDAWNLRAGASVSLHVVPPGTPVPRTNYFDGKDVLDVMVRGQLAYCVSRLEGLAIVDVREPRNPVLIANHPTLSLAQQLHVRGHLAYVAAWDAGLEIFNVADPTNLVRVGQCETPGLALDVYVADGLAYVADQTNGLQLIDVRNPGNPFRVAGAPTLGPAVGVQVKDGKAYVATSGAGLEILDVSNPLAVVRLGWLDTPGEAQTVEVIGSYAYVSDYDKGLQIIDVGNPYAPVPVGDYRTLGDIFQVQVINNLAYVAKGIGGLDVVDTVNPVLPALALPGKAGTSVHAVEVAGKHAFLADRTSGLVVAELLGWPPVSPQLFESPGSLDSFTGSNVVLSVGVIGTPPFAYQWYRDGAALSEDSSIRGVNEPHLRLNDLTNSDAGSYFAVVTSPFGVVTSAVATLTVSSPGSTIVAPGFITQPTDQASVAGGSVTFQALAAGSAPLSYRWTLNDQPVFDGLHYSGAATETLIVSNIALLQEGVYQLKAWNSAGVAQSQPAVLTFTGALQVQINNAPPGSIIPLTAGVCAEKLVISQDLILTGAGPGITILDALDRGTVITITSNATVTLSGLTIRNGRSPTGDKGGGVKNLGQLVLMDCEIINNSAESGAGIANFDVVQVLASKIQGNDASAEAGGIFNAHNARLEITDCTIAENTASVGGGIFNEGSLFTTNSTFTANLAKGTFDNKLGHGGGAYSSGQTAWLVNCTLSGNEAVAPPSTQTGGLGGAFFASAGMVEFHSTTLASNAATAAAGGVMAGSNSIVRARNSIFAGNRDGTAASDFTGILESADFNLLQSFEEASIIGETLHNVLGLDPLLGPLQNNGGRTLMHALRSGSPALDAGDCGGAATDQRGVPRPFDIPIAPNVTGGCDIGAFEYTNGAPVFQVPQQLVLDEDTVLTVPFVWDKETPAALSFVVISDNEALMPPTNVVIQLGATNWDLSITPLTNQFGVASLAISVADADGATNSTLVELVVQPVNDAPVANALAVMTQEDVSTNLVLLGGDVEGPLTFALLTGPANGIVSNLDPNTGQVTYTPATNYHGPDAFTFVVSDGLLQATGLVIVTMLPVNDSPVAGNLSLEISEDTAVNLTLPGGDVEGPTSFAILDGPTNGVLSNFDPLTGAVWYQPVSNYFGADSLSYVVSDGQLQATGTLSIVVMAVNDPPEIFELINQSVAGAATEYEFAFTVSDVDHPFESISLQVDSSNPSVIEPDLTTISGEETERLLILPHVPGRVGVTTITVVASDGLSLTTNQFLLEVRPIPLYLDGVMAENKVYDGGVTVTISNYGTLIGVLPGDEVSLEYSAVKAQFVDPTVGADKTVILSSLALTGASASSYSIEDVTTTTASILARSLAVSATGMNKVYDGSVNATVSLSDNRVAGDVLSVTNAGASFADEQVGIGKVVTVSGIGIRGPDAGNYTVNSSAVTSASILARSLAVSATGVNKVYDGSVSAVVSLSDNRVSGDVFSVTNAGASFADKHVGASKAVTVSGIGLSGPDAGNYTVNSSTVTSASITKAPLTARADDKSRPYGQPNPILTVRYIGFVGGDDIGDLDSPPVASTTATSTSLVGTYPITLIGGGDGDYAFSYVPGTLTITIVPPTILALTREGTSNIVISWSAIPGQNYRLLYVDDLRSSSWINQPPDVAATQPTAVATNASGVATQRFYRVLLLP